MNWKSRETQMKTLAGERGAVVKDPGGKLSICLVYPNSYRAAMSNLGFQAVYGLLNRRDDIRCERAFLPDREEDAELRRKGGRIFSLESGTPLDAFDIVAFSVSFENDYLHIPRMLSAGGVPPYGRERTGSHPLVLAGGAALFLNPEPVAAFLDLVCIGEAEPLLPPLLQLLTSQAAGRDALLRGAARIPGIYVPSSYEVEYDEAGAPRFRVEAGVLFPVARRHLDTLDDEPTASILFTPRAELGEMYLLEVSRGCPRGCRFCAAGFIYLPYRRRSADSIRHQALAAVQEHGKVGLVGAAVSDFPDIGGLCADIVGAGGSVSVSSLRLENLDDRMLAALVASGHRTVALAPEGGSQRLRDLVKKGINEEQILAACDRVTAHGIIHLKLYFIIGLPTETAEDLEEMLALVERIRERVLAAARSNRRIGEIVLSVNPFIPKPFTPFQWCGMEPLKSLEQKVDILRKGIGPMANVKLQVENLREAFLQAVLSRGDRRLAPLVAAMGEGQSLKAATRELGIDAAWYACRQIPLLQPLPWEIIAAADRGQLEAEYRRAFAGTVAAQG
jgi:radical SAM superfamily enzyme YgiQ (UPF0313 family)